jgi:hypothetical protein
VSLYALDQPEDRLPIREDLEALITVVDHAPRPVLFQSRFGLGRAALAGAVCLLLRGDSPQTAQQQYVLEYGCYDRTPSSTQNLIRAYEAWLSAMGRDHTPAAFRHWASQEYEPSRVLFTTAGRRPRR